MSMRAEEGNNGDGDADPDALNLGGDRGDGDRDEAAPGSISNSSNSTASMTAAIGFTKHCGRPSPAAAPATSNVFRSLYR